MSRFYTECNECNECVAFCTEGNISCPCEYGNCPNDEETEESEIKEDVSDICDKIYDISATYKN